MTGEIPIPGVDVSDSQALALPWVAWYAAGYRVVVARGSIGFRADAHFARYVAEAYAAGFVVGAYHAILGHLYYEPVLQAADFLDLITSQIAFLVLDIEAPGVSAADVVAFVSFILSRIGSMPLILYGNMDLERLLGVDNPRFAELGVWVADYGNVNLKTDRRSTPPKAVPAVPRIGRKIGWQFAGDNGRLPPYAGAVDLSLWDEMPGFRVPPPAADQKPRARALMLELLGLL